MNREAIPGPDEGVFLADGTVNETFVIEQYGLGIEEASQEIQFGTYTGTVAQMLADEGCPMGGQLHNAYEQEGIAGVGRVLGGISALDPKFSIDLSERTLQREHAGLVEPTEENDKKPDNDIDNERPPGTSPNGSGGGQSAEVTAMAHERAATELSPEEEAVPHEEPGAEPVETEPVAEAEEIQIEPPQKQRVDEEVIRGYERQQATVDTAAAPPEASDERAIDLDITVVESSATKIVDTSALEPETASAIQAPAPTKKEERSAPALAVETSEREPIVQPLEPVRREPGEDFQQPVGQSEATVVSITEASGALPAARVQPKVEGGLSQALSADIEILQPETPAQKLILSLEEILMPGTEDAEASSIFQHSQEITPETSEVARQVSEALQLPEIAESENVRAAVTNLMESVGHVHELLDAGEGTAEAEELVLAACEQLLDELGIEYEAEVAQQFARLILAAQAPRFAEEGQLIENPIEAITDEGTHEFKPGQLNVPALVLKAKQKFGPLRGLGKYALASSLSAA